MNWKAEVRKFKTLLPDRVVNFTTADQKNQLVERYNRAIRQLQQGHIDIASITLKQLAHQYPYFVQAVQLNACCQMLWSNTQTALIPLQALLKSGLLNQSERQRTEHYIRAIRAFEDVKHTKSLDQSSVYRYKGQVPSYLFQKEQTVLPLEIATRDEIVKAKKGELSSEGTYDLLDRETQYGSTLRVSHSKSSEWFLKAREAALKREKERLEAYQAMLKAEAERRKREVERRKQEAERRKQEAERRKQEVERRKQEVERRKQEVERRKQEAERRKQEAEHRQNIKAMRRAEEGRKLSDNHRLNGAVVESSDAVQSALNHNRQSVAAAPKKRSSLFHKVMGIKKPNEPSPSGLDTQIHIKADELAKVTANSALTEVGQQFETRHPSSSDSERERTAIIRAPQIRAVHIESFQTSTAPEESSEVTLKDSNQTSTSMNHGADDLTCDHQASGVRRPNISIHAYHLEGVQPDEDRSKQVSNIEIDNLSNGDKLSDLTCDQSSDTPYDAFIEASSDDSSIHQNEQVSTQSDMELTQIDSNIQPKDEQTIPAKSDDHSFSEPILPFQIKRIGIEGSDLGQVVQVVEDAATQPSAHDSVIANIDSENQSKMGDKIVPVAVGKPTPSTDRVHPSRISPQDRRIALFIFILVVVMTVLAILLKPYIGFNKQHNIENTQSKLKSSLQSKNSAQYGSLNSVSSSMPSHESTSATRPQS